MDIGILTSIASTITGYLSRGITAGKDILSFADSTLGIATVDEIICLLSEPELYDGGIVDLVFSRDQSLSLSLEPLIPLHGLSSKDVDALTGLIMQKQKTTDIFFAGTEKSITVELSMSLVKRYIERHNLCRVLPFRGPGDFPGFLSDEAVISIRVLIRNSRYVSFPCHDAFIVSLIEKLCRINRNGDYSLVIDCLEYLLELFNENRSNTDIFGILSARRRRYDDILKNTAYFSEYLHRYSMEYLISQKITPPVADVDSIRKKIYLTDLICSAVFGKPAEAGPDEHTLQYDAGQGNKSRA